MASNEDHGLEDVDFEYEEDPDLWRKMRDETWLQFDLEQVSRA